MSDETPTTSAPRNAYVDFLRAFSIVVVVLWHWAFTILVWGPDGPTATNPIGFTSGLWVLTWLFQVLPLFFFVGGYVHLLAWHRARSRGEHLGHFVGRNLRKLSVPALVLLLAWVALGLVVGVVFGVRWIPRTVLLVVSPLWFIAVYLLLIALIPVWFRVLQRFGAVSMVVIIGLVVVVDILRFRYGLATVGYVNLVLVWGLAFMSGFFHDDLVRAPSQAAWALLWGGLFGLVGLVFSGLYPGSMVGVPGEPTSNMAPPTLCIVALLAFQVGLAEVARPWMERTLEGPRFRRVVEVVNRFAMPVFLFHTTGMAIGRALLYAVTGRLGEREVPDLTWWLQRPLFVGLSLLCTLPVIWLFGHFGHRRQTVPSGA
jgi:peptidoglycan/LPS O-acetylase OafA/YrhL